MSNSLSKQVDIRPPRSPDELDRQTNHQVILSFDVEEHFRIESAARLTLSPSLASHYSERLESSTRWLIDRLAEHAARATFFILGEIGVRHRALVRAIQNAGHEVASHGWDHRRIHDLTPESFREDVRRSKEALEDIISEPVVGYRAPTFSIVPQTSWAIDVLAEVGMLYDSSIYPVLHDRYGMPGAPRCPFMVHGTDCKILEFPPATWRVLRVNAPMGGGGYFRLLPLAFMEMAIRQMSNECKPPVVMLYFHPWEFDPEQPRLPLTRLGRFRTYVGIGRTQQRLESLLKKYDFHRAADVARLINTDRHTLLDFSPNVRE